MMRAALIWLALALPAMADGLPALHGVTGVAANDVLNIRAAPDAGAAIVSVLPPGAADIEVVSLSSDGKWALVNTHEASGYAALRFLKRQPAPDWFSLAAPLRCSGTEPFWSLTMTPRRHAIYATPESETMLPLINRWSGASHAPVVGLATGDGGFISLTAAQCSDGMSDRAYGIAATLFLTGEDGPVTQTGCCTLIP